MEVPRTVTTFTEKELADVLDVSYRETFGQSPSFNTLRNAICHVLLECGRDGKGSVVKCRCFNLGNITLSAKQLKDGADYWVLYCKEQLRDQNGILNGQWKTFEMKFAANQTLEAGASHYWNFFANPKKLRALQAMGKTVLEFVDGLSAIWYMTASPAQYYRGMSLLIPVATHLAKNREVSEQLKDPEAARLVAGNSIIEITREQALGLVGLTLNQLADELAEKRS